MNVVLFFFWIWRWQRWWWYLLSWARLLLLHHASLQYRFSFFAGGCHRGAPDDHIYTSGGKPQPFLRSIPLEKLFAALLALDS